MSTISNLTDAKSAFVRLCEVMDALLKTLALESELVRNGRLHDAAKMEVSKTELAGRYASQIARVKVSVPYLTQHAPQLLEDLRRRHEEFRALLQINMTVLATAHAVSEGIVRGVVAELAKKSAPQTYGASGRTAAAPRSAIEPVALSRTL